MLARRFLSTGFPMTNRLFTSRMFSSVNFLSQDPSTADILITKSKDPYLNIAIEEYLYEHCDLKNPVLYLWRNDKCVIMGKHQNPWKECNV
jgi:lipoate-protein ligase A